MIRRGNGVATTCSTASPLRAAHSVAIAGYEMFADLVTGCGLEFRALPGDDFAEHLLLIGA